MIQEPYHKKVDHTHCPEKNSPCGIEGSHRCCLCGFLQNDGWKNRQEDIDDERKAQGITSLQKESEWESEFESRFHTTNNDYDGGKMLWVQKEEVKSFLKEIISNREKEIAEEVKKKRKEPTHSGTGSISWYNQALDEVLLIIKK